MCLALDDHGRQLSYTDGAWADPVPTLTRSQAAVSCSSETFCLTYGGDVSQSFDGHAWSGAYPIGDVTDSGGLTSLSCYAPGSCLGAAYARLYVSRSAG